MTNAELYKVLCEKIDTNHSFNVQALVRIEAQTTKTNGRVNALEVKVWELEKENLEIRVIKKYPKSALLGLVGIVFVCIYFVVVGYNKVNGELDTIKARQQIILNEKDSSMKK